MKAMIELIRQDFDTMFKAIFPAIPAASKIEITYATKPSFGHFQCNSAMKLSSILKMSPIDVANIIVKKSNTSNARNVYERLEVAGPGFINIWLSDAFIQDRINILVKNNFIPLMKNQYQKIIVDFSSPNIAKSMHVGHLRSTIIGDCIANTFEYFNYDVLRLNHIGDWGTSFGMLIAYMKDNFDEKAFQNFSLDDLEQSYKKAKKLFDQSVKFSEHAKKEVVLLQNGNLDSLKIWKQICETSRAAYREIYNILNINIIDRGESFYNSSLDELVMKLSSRKIATESEGALCIFFDDILGKSEKPLPFIIKKSDGGYNYATTDLAALLHRINEENAKRIIYVTDVGQSLHFDMLFRSLEKIDSESWGSVELDHVGFGLICGDDGKKMRTRSGETVALKVLIEKSIAKASEILLTRMSDKSEKFREEVARVIGINALKYADLSNNRRHDYKFSYEKMLRFEGNTANYIMYAYVRILSLKRKTKKLKSLQYDDITQILTSEVERQLIFHILKFDDVLLRFLNELLPHVLCEYLYELTNLFNAFFRDCKIIESDKETTRLGLITMLEKIYQSGFKILGITELEAM
jgi:arginyl-tRNA synthetase